MSESAAETPVRPIGLTSAEVAERVAAGRVNRTDDSSSRTLTQILRGNLFTLFNAIIGVAFVVVLLVGDPRDALFGLVIIINAAIGVIQEYRAKRTLDRLAVVSAPRVRVLRDGIQTTISPDDLVLDDCYELGTGDQVPTDCEVISARGLEVDESMLTGESDPVDKAIGDPLMSGSFLVAGSAVVRASAVGPDSYAHQLTSAARRFSLVHSELRAGINRVLVWITWIIGPVILALLWSQVRAHGGFGGAIADGSWRKAVVGAVAGVVGMVPEGLVLLTSISFALAAMTLARRQVLVQELPAVEVLARVDIICLDKTGTLTVGEIGFDSIEAVGSDALAPGVGLALAALGADPQANATAAALRGADLGVASTGLSEEPQVVYDVPFSSARKWSALTVDGTHWVFGGPDVVLRGSSSPTAKDALRRAEAAQADGVRALVLAIVEEVPTAQGGPVDPRPVALVQFRERVRPDAAETLRYFADQGVDLRIISGDNPVTVAAIARQVGIECDGGFDARDLPTDLDELAAVLAEHRVFGRVSPEQKRAMVHALQRSGHTVAMTGDGVNDALALKDADLGIAMGSGADVTKSVARLVLVDGQFSRLPGVVAEGRRVIANVERVANLFLTKTTYAVLLAVAVSLLAWPYPFLPRHLTVISSLTIGIPAFVLALAPNNRRYRPGFLARVLAFAVPCGVVAAATVLGVTAWARATGHEGQASVVATLSLLWVGLWVLSVLARPWVWWRVALVATMAAAGIIGLLIPVASTFFELSWPSGDAGWAVVIAGVSGSAAVELVYRYLTPRLTRKLS